MKPLTRRSSLVRLASFGAAGLLGGCATEPAARREHFVLIHGGWHGAWCWSRLAARLRDAGHAVTAPDLPAHGDDATPLEEASLASYVKRVTDVLDASPQPVVLVGHSIGGMTIAQAAEERPGQVRTLVYLSAFVMGDGETASSRRDANSALNGLVQVESRGGKPLLARLDPSMPDRVRDALYHDVNEVDLRTTLARLGPEPLAPWFEPLRLSAARFGKVDKVYLHCSEDRATTPAQQASHAARWPVRKTLMLPSSHSPFLSMPGRLADALTSSLV